MPTTQQFILFLSGLILPALYQRVKFAVNRSLFHTTRLRKKTGLNIHHGHWGLLLVLISTWMLVFGLHNSLSICLAGFGWGLILDEIVPMLKMPSSGNRDLELDVYARSLVGTIALITSAVALAIILFLVYR